MSRLGDRRSAGVATLVALVLALVVLPPGVGTLTSSSAAVPLVSARGATADATTILATATDGSRPRRDPRRTRPLFVRADSAAATAGKAFARIARRAQPRWITDYYPTPEGARDVTRGFVEQARQARQTPVLVVYNIPDRDCGRYSSPDDQITDPQYRAWIRGIADGLRGSKSLVILEPDAIAFIGDPLCTGRGDRLGLLRYATKRLTRAGAWVYLDAGHSNWRQPADMARMLRQAGVAHARGFSTNVANVRTDRAEKTYARALVQQLRKRKVSGVKYVIDTGRNGRALAADEDFCNPSTARLGRAPQLVFQGSLDGYLWVKPPGESDGACNGGPNAGAWFPLGACQLMGYTGWDGARCQRS